MALTVQFLMEMKKLLKFDDFIKHQYIFHLHLKKWVQNKHTHSIVKKDKGEKFAVIKPL